MIFLISYAQRILSLWERKFQIKIKIQSSNTLSYIVESRDRFITDSKERSDTIYKKMKDKLSCADPDEHLRLWERKVSRVKNDINMVAVSPLFTTFTPTFIMGRYKVSITKNQYRYHFLESRNHQRESKSIGFIFPSWVLCFVSFEKIEVFQVLSLPRSPKGKQKIYKLFYFFCFRFRSPGASGAFIFPVQLRVLNLREVKVV